MMERLGELESLIADENGYEAEIEAAEILRGIGIPDEKHSDLMATLPNDYKFRVLLAQALFGGSDALAAGRADQLHGPGNDPLAGRVFAGL